MAGEKQNLLGLDVSSAAALLDVDPLDLRDLARKAAGGFGFGGGPGGGTPPGPVGGKAKARVAVGRFLDRIPPIMGSKLSAPLAQSFMSFWLSNASSVKGPSSPDKSVHATRALETKALKAWKHSSKFDSIAKDKPWMNGLTGSRANVIGKAFAALSKVPKAQQSLTFPDPVPAAAPPIAGGAGLASAPFRNDRAWAETLEPWSVGFVHDGAGLLEFATSSFDDFGLALGKFAWLYMMFGTITRKPTPQLPGLTEVRMDKVGIYAFDSYDFNGGQPLGFWNVDAGDEGVSRTPGVVGILAPLTILTNDPLASDAGYYPTMGWVRVDNGSFRRYRTETNNGKDFEVYSDVEMIPINPPDRLFFDSGSGLEITSVQVP